MRISANLGNNINFIEQKASVSKENKNQSDSKTLSYSDSFTSTQVASKDIIAHNDSLGMLQLAQESINALKEKNQNLKTISQKLNYTDNKISLEKEFESVIEEMFEVVDGTIYNKTQLFYTNMSFSQTQAMPSFMLSDIISIEDLSLEDTDSLTLFDTKLSNLHEELNKAKEFAQIVSFNTLAVSSASQVNMDNLNLDFQKEASIPSFGKEEIQRAHDTDSLRDKVLSLLAD